MGACELKHGIIAVETFHQFIYLDGCKRCFSDQYHRYSTIFSQGIIVFLFTSASRKVIGQTNLHVLYLQK
jgi:hypothetical protein